MGDGGRGWERGQQRVEGTVDTYLDRRVESVSLATLINTGWLVLYPLPSTLYHPVPTRRRVLRSSERHPSLCRAPRALAPRLGPGPNSGSCGYNTGIVERETRDHRPPFHFNTLIAYSVRVCTAVNNHVLTLRNLHDAVLAHVYVYLRKVR